MIKNFDSVREQLSQLAAVINAFKSEAVQLRIIELVLGQESMEHAGDTGPEEKQSRKLAARRKSQKSEGGSTSKASKKSRPSGGTGAVATLSQLAAGTFFDTPRTIGDIIEHCKHNLARGFKANELSGKLARMISDGQLTRKKNADKQYEYKKP